MKERICDKRRVIKLCGLLCQLTFYPHWSIFHVNIWPNGHNVGVKRKRKRKKHVKKPSAKDLRFFFPSNTLFF